MCAKLARETRAFSSISKNFPPSALFFTHFVLSHVENEPKTEKEGAELWKEGKGGRGCEGKRIILKMILPCGRFFVFVFLFYLGFVSIFNFFCIHHPLSLSFSHSSNVFSLIFDEGVNNLAIVIGTLLICKWHTVIVMCIYIVDCVWNTYYTRSIYRMFITFWQVFQGENLLSILLRLWKLQKVGLVFVHYLSDRIAHR